MSSGQQLTTMRIDKWLWCARFYKTRALAATAIKGNRIKLNGEVVKPARNVQVGDTLIIRKPPFEYSISILKLSPNRLSGSQAALLYEETAESIQKREQLNTRLKAESAIYPRTHGRPTKRDRRHIIRFTRMDGDSTDD